MPENKMPHFVISVEGSTVSAEIYQGAPERFSTSAKCDLSLGEEVTEGEVKDTRTACAGEWTRCISRIRAHPYQMTIRNARDLQHGHQLAHKCRDDVIDTTWYSSSVLICAPYIACNAS